MKLKKEFVMHISSSETVLVATGNAKFSGVVKGNRTLGEILTLLSSDTTEADIINTMAQNYDAPREVIERDVKTALENLRKIEAIEE